MADMYHFYKNSYFDEVPEIYGDLCESISEAFNKRHEAEVIEFDGIKIFATEYAGRIPVLASDLLSLIEKREENDGAGIRNESS